MLGIWPGARLEAPGSPGVRLEAPGSPGVRLEVPPGVSAPLAGINRSPLPGSTLFMIELNWPKRALAMFTAFDVSGAAGTAAGAAGTTAGAAGTGAGSGSSTRIGCWGAAAAAPAPSPMVAIAASARPKPAVIRPSALWVEDFVNVFSDKGLLLIFR